ncbi:MAG: hypothetical protein HYR91_07060 [Flavobacteriia bacterium]|nr:hypothetical protein [Flavobacteriia bacterium]
MLREIDLRYLKDEYQKIFWETLSKIIQNLKGDESDFLFYDLFDLYQKSENEEEKEPDEISDEEYEKYKLIGIKNNWL